MDRNELQILRQRLEDKIIPDYLFEQNDKDTRDAIGYDVMRFLTEKNIDFTTINLHTPKELIDQGKIQLQVDDFVFIIET